ncbi:NADP-dependent 3-hydroxy acid dehydrogenase YdfG [Paenibacillus sp. 1_12]|uniref:SDR family oxidoreductase n=1 Tax=Paenibacillus sp. 1_12 TaxID=1566278 RepID=UPI0008DF9521|nr:SDR family oxidoreductase [Paenibacillus sp. 1_12]SFL58815.1 NADP-dependent 3-hydroxy acid dehydrogenase YdfG [Paenibacillus sp. 1_12]
MQDKVVAITGGAGGIGKEVGELLASVGATVWSGDLQTNPSALSGKIRYSYLDVTDEESVVSFFSNIQNHSGRIDLLINCAGVGLFKPITEISLSEWKKVIDINLTGTFLCSKEAFKLMKLNSGGRIINISSVAGYIPLANNGVYGTSKYAVHGFSQILNEEGKNDNIRVTTIFLGATGTEIINSIGDFEAADLLNVKDVAEVFLDLAKKPLHMRIDEIKVLPPKGIL